jgi:Protein of unknown function (DUF3086)
MLFCRRGTDDITANFFFVLGTPKSMNPEGTNPDRQPDLRSPAHPAEIIDVRVVEEISSIPTGSILHGRGSANENIWDGDEQVPTPASQPTSSNSHPESSTATDPIEEDNWAVLLDEIGQDLAPDSQVTDLELDSITLVANSATSGNLDLNYSDPDSQVTPLLRAEAEIKAEIANLQATQAQLQQQISSTQNSFGQIIQTSIADLEQRRQKLQSSVEQLERRRDRIKAEISKSFAGGSQDVAIRLQGFKDYLVGSLQDLVVIAEEIEFPQPPPAQIRIQTPIQQPPIATKATPRNQQTQSPQFAEPVFKTTATKVRGSINRYRNAPDYYAPTWQLRRTLEGVHADKVSDWFFSKDGRGAIRTMGSRLQNILVAAAAVSALRELYGDYLRTIVLANLPERLGDWRRGFQDCLGLSKTDFGGNGGIILFEDPDALVQKVDRIVANKEMPLIIIDNSEGQISLSILQYPLWLAFAPDPNQQLDDYREYR